MTCTLCHGPLPRHPETARAADGTEWALCGWKCAVIWRASQGDKLARQLAARMGWKEATI